jgi:hypothetical protein
MKKVYLMLMAISCMVCSCKDDDAQQYKIGVSVQSDFEQDNVQVLIDGQEIINQKLQTIDLLGVCLIDNNTEVSVSRREGGHSIKVIVNNVVTKTEKFTLYQNRYIGINYNQQTNEITFLYSDQPFVYD